MYSSISECIGLRYSSVSRGNPSSGSVNQSHGGSWVVVDSWIERLKWGASPFFAWGVSLSGAVSMFDRHLFMACKDSATSSARVSHSSSSGRADLKIKPTWLSWSLNCEGFFFVPNLEHARHCVREGGNCSVVQSLLHVGHCLFIAVANALHHQPFLWVLWLVHMSSRSLNRSWLVINDLNRFCEDDAPRLRSSSMRPRVGVLSWHSNSSCSLWVFLSLVPSRFFCFLFESSRTARHLFVRALPNSSMRIHCIPSVAWDTRVGVGFLVKVKFFCNSSLINWGMVLVHSSSSHPSSTRSSIWHNPCILHGTTGLAPRDHVHSEMSILP